MEKHHLISMMYYEEYTNDLDDIGNIVSLCPNCHRKIHLGNKNDVKDMLEVLYEQQKVKLEKAGLPISLDLLKEKYGVI
jgi:5-methylcytosine-specific restriction protein A